MRVLLCIHHRLDARAGVARATLGLAEALERLGCSVDFLSFDDVYPPGPETKWRNLAFPWRVHFRLTREAARYDIIDASTGDAWVWGQLGRPGSHRTALVTRSHGLEHVAVEADGRSSRKFGRRNSWRYAVYHRGYRLWEVERSLRVADHIIVLNRIDEQFITRRFAIPQGRVSVIANGVDDRIHMRAPAPEGGPLRLTFLGNWLRRKGKESVVEVIKELHLRGLDFTLSLFGTGSEAQFVKDEFPAEVQSRLTVTAEFEPSAVSSLLAGHHILLFPSLSEGFSLALGEAMACGLVPVATEVGGAAEAIQHMENGFLVPVGDVSAMVSAVQTLDGDRKELRRMSARAVEVAQRYRWPLIAASTLGLYESVIARRREIPG